MGDDLRPVEAARNSFAGQMKGDERDLELAQRLHDNHHDSPFEFIQMTWEVKCPIFVARQWMRHRSGSYAEFSYRWGNPKNISDSDHVEFYEPYAADFQDNFQLARETYQRAIRTGIPKEQARAVLPVAAYTRFWWSVNWRNWAHFEKLRLSPDAQHEIRVYAEAMKAIASEQWPRLSVLFFPAKV